MNKRTFLPVVIIFIAGFITYFLQSLMFADLRFDLMEVYLFHALASSSIYVILDLFSKTRKFGDQIGFLYLGTLFLKVAFFVGVFHDSIMSINEMTKKEGLSLLLPLFIFLFLEVFFVARILNRTALKT